MIKSDFGDEFTKKTDDVLVLVPPAIPPQTKQPPDPEKTEPISLNDEGLPEDILCPRCGTDLKLSKAERINRKFKCSQCNETFDVVD